MKNQKPESNNVVNVEPINNIKRPAEKVMLKSRPMEKVKSEKPISFDSDHLNRRNNYARKAIMNIEVLLNKRNNLLSKLDEVEKELETIQDAFKYFNNTKR